MRHHSFSLNVPAEVAIGAAQNVRDLRDKYVQVVGTFTATMAVEASLNGTDFIAVASSVSTPSFVPIPHPATHIRVRVTAFTSGTPGAVIGGFDDNG